MAFIYTDLYPNTASNGSYCGSWNYTTLDTVATASAVGYLNAVATRISVGDIIFVSVVDAVGKTRTTLVDQAQLYVTDITAGVVTTSEFSSGGGVGSIEVVIDGSGSVLTTGVKGYLPQAPFGCTLTQATMIANASGSIVLNIWKCTYAQFDAGATHPVVGDKITDSSPPTITTATKSQDSSLTGWNTTIAAGDVLAFNIDSVTTITRIALSLKYTKA